MTGQDDAATTGADDELEFDGLTASELPALSLDELRARRDAVVSTETGLSYLRRLVQGPLDLVRAELEHRAGGERSDVAGLVEELAGVLTETGRTGVGGRISLNLEPTEVDPELESELHRITGGGARTADVPLADDDDLVAFAGELDTLEREVSARRRRLHRTIDVLNGELAQRYRSGEATVESTLAAPKE